MKAFLALTATLVSLTGLGVYHHTHRQSQLSPYAQKLLTIAETVNNTPGVTWTAGRNIRFDLSDEETVSANFIKPELFLTRTKTLPLKTFAPEVHAQVPESFDSREQWPNCESLKEVRDQSCCGSCWAFGASETMSDRICIHSNGKHQRVSSEDLVECCADCGDGCNGGFPDAAFSYWKHSGVVTGDLYGDKKYCKAYAFPPCAHHIVSDKYKPCPSVEYDTPTCKLACTNGDDYEKSKWFADTTYNNSGERDMMAEISQNGSVELTIQVYEDFLTYKSGVYQHVTGESKGGHAMKMIGYGTENGVKYWLIANSWNESWGEGGFMKFLRGENHCEIENSVVSGIPKFD